MQTNQAFQQVQDALSFFVQSYKEIAAWCAVVERLAGFQQTLERVRRESSEGGVQVGEDGPAQLSVRGVDLYLPDGRLLVANINLSLVQGETVLLGGASGSGKSTLIRAIAGIWPFGRGEIRLPRDAQVLFLPQRPYLPIGMLRDVVSYPMSSRGVDDATLREALEAVGLSDLGDRLDEAAHWALQLSPGQQQRIAFARALVQKPDWLFLDEATSALDEMSEARLYRLVRDRLPGTTVFSIGHRGTLGAFHSRRLTVQMHADAPASIVEASGPDAGEHGALARDPRAAKSR
jgi:putative ATP-binding cassette transporter